ncbi:MAG: hypothetical protein R3A52_23400 [Polyangiales bacterium]
MTDDDAPAPRLPPLVLDALRAVALALLLVTIAVFSQGVGLRFLYFAF